MDEAASVGRVVRLEVHETGTRVEYVEQSACDAAVQRADRRLVLKHGVAVGAVRKTDRHGRVAIDRHGRLEPERRQRAHEGVGAGRGVGCREFSADCSAGGLDRAQARAARRDRATQPTREILIPAWRLTSRPGARRDRPAIARSSTRPRLARAHDEAVALHAVQMNPHAVWMQVEMLGELDRRRRATELAEQPKELRARGLGERIGRVDRFRDVKHPVTLPASRDFTHHGFAKQAGGATAHYWFPKMTGRMYDERLGKWHFWTTLVTFNLTFAPMNIIGIQGMPRRVADYSSQFATWNLIISIASFALGLSTLIFVYNMVASWRGGPRAAANPWRALTLEWQVSSPPPVFNFDTLPTIVGGPYEYGVPGAVHAIFRDGGQIPVPERDRVAVPARE